MILKETILSAFTERGTLLKWLKKVEAALNTAVLTDISVVQVSETQIKLKFTFENGDFVESPVLTLPRGEPGKDGLDGEGIAATIEVGTVTTGAAGTNASVTNVGTEQRAILNFVIPRGANGADGSAGVGFDDADEISINDGAISITAGANGVNIAASLEVAVGDEILEIPSTMYLPIKGSESIVIDVDESGDFIDIHLDAVIAAKLNRALVTPMSAPASISLVAVDTSNTQTMLTLGDGLSVQNGALVATGGGGGGGGGGAGATLYVHRLNFEGYSGACTFACDTPDLLNGLTVIQIMDKVHQVVIPVVWGDNSPRAPILIFDPDAMDYRGGVWNSSTSSKDPVTGVAKNDQIVLPFSS